MGQVRARILIVDDEPIKRSVLEDQLGAAGFDVCAAANPLEAEPLLANTVFDIVLTDLRMPGQDGLSFLRELKARRPEQAAIVMTAYGSVPTAVEAMKLGAFDYLQKPFTTEELVLKLDRLLEFERLAGENESLRRQLAHPGAEKRLVGDSAAMRRVLERVRAVAPLDTTVLIEGESGTGKELVAHLLHETSPRANGPFVAVSCAALPKELMESELFGHEPGAFTGATRRRLGRFECAHGGTVFLDDVDDTPLDVQIKLLRVLQERSFERVGGERPVRVNLRIVAATKKSLAALAAANQFRQDLYYRLSVVPIRLPPLREHLEDIPLLVEYLLERLSVRLNRGQITIAPAAIGRLREHAWPGNVRELEHVLEQMAAVSRTGALDLEDVPPFQPDSRPASLVSVDLERADAVDLAAVLAAVEERLLRWALDRAKGNLAQAATLLGIPRSTLQYKLSKQAPTAP